MPLAVISTCGCGKDALALHPTEAIGAADGLRANNTMPSSTAATTTISAAVIYRAISHPPLLGEPGIEETGSAVIAEGATG